MQSMHTSITIHLWHCATLTGWGGVGFFSCCHAENQVIKQPFAKAKVLGLLASADVLHLVTQKPHDRHGANLRSETVPCTNGTSAGSSYESGQEPLQSQGTPGHTGSAIHTSSSPYPGQSPQSGCTGGTHPPPAGRWTAPES